MINIINSTSGNLSSYGGAGGFNGVYFAPGKGGDINITDDAIDLSNLYIQLYGGVDSGDPSYPSINGTLRLNYTSSFIDSEANTTIQAGFRLKFTNSTSGIIDFMSSNTASSINMNTNLSSNIIITHNFAWVNPAMLNKPANITFFNVSIFTEPAVINLANTFCNANTNPGCYNFTPLNGTAEFNVSYWDDNYTIGEIGNIFNFSNAIVPCDSDYTFSKNYYVWNNVTFIGNGVIGINGNFSYLSSNQFIFQHPGCEIDLLSKGSY